MTSGCDAEAGLKADRFGAEVHWRALAGTGGHIIGWPGFTLFTKLVATWV
jgi:hypothetical protein